MSGQATSSKARLLEERTARYDLFDQLNRPYLQWQMSQFQPFLGRRILEVGCGVGGFTELLGQRDLVYGIDVEGDVLARAQSRFDDSAHRFELLDISHVPEAKRAQLKRERFDTVLCVNVLEHIEDDAGALSTMADLLVPEGWLSLLVPAHQSLYGTYDRVDGHFRRYSRRLLSSRLQGAGLKVERLYHFNVVGALGWWAQYRLLRRSIHGGTQYGVMNRVLPVMRAVEARVKPPFGLSLVAVCRK